MKVFLLLVASATISFAAPDPGELRNQGLAAEKAGNFAASSELLEKAADAALAAGDRRDAFQLLTLAGGRALQSGGYARAVALTTRGIAMANELLPQVKGEARKEVHLGRIDCRGERENALSALDRYAEGYAELRAIWRDIEQYRVAEEGGAPGDPRQAADLARWSPQIRRHVWRSTFREAEYLSTMGHTQAALAVLRQGVRQASSLGRVEDVENVFAAQLRTVLAGKLDFLGYQREGIEVLRAALTDSNIRLTGTMHWSAKMNLALRTQRLEGPTPANLDIAQECHRELSRASVTGQNPQSAWTLMTMVSEYKRDYDETGKLRPLVVRIPQQPKPPAPGPRVVAPPVTPPPAKDARAEDTPVNFRDGANFLSARKKKPAISRELAATFDPGRDGEFISILNETRKQGNKHDEPALYRAYGNYLRRIGRPADALRVYREALRLTQSFGWVLLEPRARIDVINALTDMGDFAGAEAEWVALERKLAAIPDLPPKLGIDVRFSRIEWHLMLGDGKKAQAAVEEARTFASAQKVNAWTRRAVDGILPPPATIAAAQPAVPAVAKAPFAPVSIEPSRVVTGAAAGDLIRARFTLRNPDDRARTGELRARGPAIQLGLETTPRRIAGSATAGIADKEMRLPMVLAAGEDLSVVLEMKRGPAEGKKAAVQVAWHEGAARAVADWNITTEHDPFAVSVVNASQMRLNAFHSVSFTQQIVRRAAGPGLVNFRFVASAPLRLEYYDAATHRLLAVDADGNGVFTDPGDSLLADNDGNLAPDMEFDGKEKMREIEVAVFSTATAPPAGKQIIEAELLTEKGWEKVARNELE